MTRRDILDKYELVVLKPDDFLDTELTAEEAELFEKRCQDIIKDFDALFNEGEDVER